VADDVLINKVAAIERCLGRIREEFREPILISILREHLVDFEGLARAVIRAEGA